MSAAVVAGARPVRAVRDAWQAGAVSTTTAREADALELAADGSPVEQIAARVHVAPGTVRNHLSSAVAKLGVTNRHEAVALARRNGWV